ncbi:MAG TPA: hypothetical protein VL614_26695 [Acetobacteraceae bacterium]|nr:hypothetical protein [Acetobacteraceae bacterium]
MVRGHRGVFSVAVVWREEARLFIARASDEQLAARGEAVARRSVSSLERSCV